MWSYTYIIHIYNMWSYITYIYITCEVIYLYETHTYITHEVMYIYVYIYVTESLWCTPKTKMIL